MNIGLLVLVGAKSKPLKMTHSLMLKGISQYIIEFIYNTVFIIIQSLAN